MRLKKLFIARTFGIVLVCLAILLAVSNIGISEYSRQTIGSEFIRLNQAALTRQAYMIGRNLSDVKQYGKKISVNSRLLELMAESGEDVKEAHAIIYEMQSEFNVSYMNGSSYIETYVVGKNGKQVSASHIPGEDYVWETLSADSRLEPLFSGETDVVIFPTSRQEQENGIMKYSFQMIFVMQELLNGEIRGLVVLDVSELLLYRQYKDYLENNNRLTVIDSEGKLISDSDKNKIGTFYGYTSEELKVILEKDNVNDKIVDGNFQLCERIGGTDWLLVSQITEEDVFASLRALQRTMLIWGVGMCLLLAGVIMVAAARMIFQRVNFIKMNMRRVTEGDLTTRIEVKTEDEFGEIETSFNMMVSEIEKLIYMIHQSEQQKRAAEMDFMHAQINSHFIQNTLTSIRFMLERGKTEEAGEMLLYFSRLLRQTLSHSDEFIPLQQEIEMLKNYVGLQSYRYPDRFEVSWEISENVMECKALKMLLQPILENAIFHGMSHRLLHICVSARQEKRDLVITVEDNGVGMSQEIQETVLKKETRLNHVGLYNVHERLKLYYGEEYGITIDGRKGDGTIIVLRMPITRTKEQGEKKE